jgi:2'-5' RNA ligase
MFQRELGAALQLVGLGGHLEQRPFVPHVTIARGTALAKPIAIAPIIWEACAFELVDSLVGQSVYRPLGRWLLTGA